jgi:hypothetical protein
MLTKHTINMHRCFLAVLYLGWLLVSAIRIVALLLLILSTITDLKNKHKID